MRNDVKGFTLIEVLVAVLLLSIGLLGLASLQAWGLRMTGNAMHRSQATLFANDMVERIRANVPGTDSGAYTVTLPADYVCPAQVFSCHSVAVCNSTEMARSDYLSVMCGSGSDDGAGMDNLLPQGALRVSCPSTNVECSVDVSWFELEDQFAQEGPGPQQQNLRVTFFP